MFLRDVLKILDLRIWLTILDKQLLVVWIHFFGSLATLFSVKSLIFHEIISIFAETIVSIMDYINEFHKAWIERTRQSIASWSKQPASSEEVRQQQERLNRQRAIREGKSKNWLHLLIQIICGLTCTISLPPSWKQSLEPPQCTLFNFLLLPLS